MFFAVEGEVTFYDIFKEYLDSIGENVKIQCAWLSPRKKFAEVRNCNGEIIGRNGFKNLPIGKNTFQVYLKDIAIECGFTCNVTLKLLRDTILSTWSHTGHSNEMVFFFFYNLFQVLNKRKLFFIFVFPSFNTIIRS